MNRVSFKMVITENIPNLLHMMLGTKTKKQKNKKKEKKK